MNIKKGTKKRMSKKNEIKDVKREKKRLKLNFGEKKYKIIFIN